VIEPTERALWLLVLVGAVGALGLGVPLVGEAAPFMLAGVGLAALVDAILAGSPRVIRGKRVLPEHLVEGRPAELVLELSAPRAVDVEIVDSLPARALPAGEDPDRRHDVRLPADQSVLVTTTASFSRRGPHRLGRVSLRAKGPLGLVKRRARLALTDEIDVLPDVARIGARAERLLRGRDEGGRRRRLAKEGRELDSLREYVPGDDPRLVEWKVSARRGQLVVKRMRPEARQEIVVAVDAGRHLSGAHAPVDGGEQRLDVAMTAALTLCAAGLSRGDRASLLAFAGDVVAWGPPGEGKGHLRRLARAVNDVEAAAEESDYGEVARFLIARQKRRAMVVFVTDVLDEPSVRSLAAAVARLRGRHLPVVVALGDPALARLSRAEPSMDASDVDKLLPASAARLVEHRRKGLAALEAAGAVVVDAPAPRAAALAVETYATLKAQGRL
jgi:uncharacterized protein (DUF58 family)